MSYEARHSHTSWACGDRAIRVPAWNNGRVGYGSSAMTEKGRLVYSTGAGRICPDCGWPEHDCKCSRNRVPSESIPARIVAKLRVEKTGRGGKTVTVVYDPPGHAAFLKELAQA